MVMANEMKYDVVKALLRQAFISQTREKSVKIEGIK